MWQRVFISLLFLASCCMLISAQGTERGPEDVTFCELSKNPLAYSGKRIRIRAVYSYMFEVSRLKSPTCCSDHGESIWVDFDGELHGKSKSLFKTFPKGMGVVLAVFLGRIETGKVYGTFGERVRLVVDQIDKVEEKAKPAAGQNPAWVPQNCDEEIHQSPGKQIGRVRPSTNFGGLAVSCYTQPSHRSKTLGSTLIPRT